MREMKALSKPFVVVLNAKDPASPDTEKLKEALAERYGVSVLAKDVLHMGEEDVTEILESILMEFPLKKAEYIIPEWMRALSDGNSILAELFEKIGESAEGVTKMRDVKKLLGAAAESEDFEEITLEKIDAS